MAQQRANARAEKEDESIGRNPYLFVVGCPRSGTTLLQRMLDSHPRLAVANDSHFIPRAIEDVAIGMDPPLTPELVERARTYRRFYRLNLPETAVDEAAEGTHTYREFVGALYSEYARRRGKPLAGEKTPDYVKHLPRLHDLFPWARIVHIIRDGRDVYLSATDWRSGGELRRRFIPLHEEPVMTTAMWWEWLVRTGREDAKDLDSNLYYEIRYEALVSNPAEECEKLCDFLGIPYDSAMLRFHEGKERPKPGRSAKNAWLKVTSGLRDWRSKMPAEDVERFEAAAGNLLEELGYPLAASHPSSEVMRTVALARDSFVRELLQGGDQPPRSWWE